MLRPVWLNNVPSAIISFAYTCQMNFYTIYSELAEPTEAKMNKISVSYGSWRFSGRVLTHPCLYS